MDRLVPAVRLNVRGSFLADGSCHVRVMQLPLASKPRSDAASGGADTEQNIQSFSTMNRTLS